VKVGRVAALSDRLCLLLWIACLPGDVAAIALPGGFEELAVAVRAGWRELIGGLAEARLDVGDRREHGPGQCAWSRAGHLLHKRQLVGRDLGKRNRGGVPAPERATERAAPIRGAAQAAEQGQNGAEAEDREQNRQKQQDEGDRAGQQPPRQQIVQ
jgi:hypothetical protein